MSQQLKAGLDGHAVEQVVTCPPEVSAPVLVVGWNNWQGSNQLMTAVPDWIDCYLRRYLQMMYLDGLSSLFLFIVSPLVVGFSGIKVLVGKSGKDWNIL